MWPCCGVAVKACTRANCFLALDRLFALHAVTWTPAEGQQGDTRRTRRGQREDNKRAAGGQEEVIDASQHELNTKNPRSSTGSKQASTELESQETDVNQDQKPQGPQDPIRIRTQHFHVVLASVRQTAWMSTRTRCR